MTDQIKISEVSAILRKELEDINTGIKLEEVGTVLQVRDGVVRIYGLDNAEAKTRPAKPICWPRIIDRMILRTAVQNMTYLIFT